MPKEILKERENQRRQPIVYAGLACLLAAVLAWAGYMHVMAGRAQADLEQVQTEVQGLRALSQQITAKEGEISKVKAQIAEVQKIAESRKAWNSLLDTIRAPLPSGAWITSVQAAPLVSVDAPLPSDAGGVQDNNRAAQLQAVMGGNTPGDPGDAAKPVEPQSALHIKGLIYEDIFKPSLLTDYVETLKQSPLVHPQTRVLQRKEPKTGDFVRGFWIQVVLNQPLPK